jgi:hypothetical protein
VTAHAGHIHDHGVLLLPALLLLLVGSLLVLGPSHSPLLPHGLNVAFVVPLAGFAGLLGPVVHFPLPRIVGGVDHVPEVAEMLSTGGVHPVALSLHGLGGTVAGLLLPGVLLDKALPAFLLSGILIFLWAIATRGLGRAGWRPVSD